MSDPTDREHTGAPGGAARTLAAAFGVLLVLAAGALGPACLLDGSPIEGAGTAGRGEGPTTSGGGAVSAGGGGGAVSAGGSGGDPGTTTSGSGGQGGGTTTSTTSTTTSTTSTTSSTTSTTTTSTGGGECTPGCDECGKGSLDPGGPCGDEAGLCVVSGSCPSYLVCVNNCGADWCSPQFKTCQEGCLVMYNHMASKNLSCCVRSACTAECGIAPCP
jgi:hypothetical protein